MKTIEAAQVILKLVVFLNVANYCESRVTRFDTVHFQETHRRGVLQFDFLGQEYILDLERNSAPFHRNFRVVTTSGSAADVRKEFIGYVREPYYGKGILTKVDHHRYIGNIFFHNDTLHLEPANLLNISADPNTIVGYFGSDTNITLNLSEGEQKNKVSYRRLNPLLRFRREKRSAFTSSISNEKKNRCPLKIVADYSFYSTTGKNNAGIVTKFIVNMIARMNEIYTRVNWDEGKEDSINGRGRFENMGFSIKEIKILDRPNATDTHYNSFNKIWDANELLHHFAISEASNEFCVVHLLTARNFKISSTLGMAFVAEKRWDAPPGGICSRKDWLIRRMAYFNVILTTVFKSDESHQYPLITKEIDIVIAHEYGHSWGANHDTDAASDDPDVAQCSPSYQDGGKFIMDPTAQRGYDANNVYFSPCSKKQIREALDSKWSRCFEEEKTSYCGNGIVEDDEECDNGNDDDEKCCSSSCKLEVGAKCSPLNHICCTETCLFHNSSHICLAGDDLLCKDNAYCNGVSGECPSAPPVEDGQSCIEDGECFNGNCRPFCEKRSIGKESCICEDVELSCHRCCKSTNGTCAPEPGSPNLPDGTLCTKGVCRKNKCVYQAVDEVKGLFFEPFRDSATFKDSVKAHLVLFVVIIISFIYCIVYVNVRLREQHSDTPPEPPAVTYRKVFVPNTQLSTVPENE